MFSLDDLFNEFMQMKDEDLKDLANWGNSSSQNTDLNNQNDWWSGNHQNLDRKISEEIKIDLTELDGTEIINSDTILANTFFTYFDSSLKPLNCIIRDTKPGEVRCLGLLSSGTHNVTITTENKKKFTITASSPFLNLYYVKDVGYVEEDPESKKTKTEWRRGEKHKKYYRKN
jgi:hypothetical protein